MIRALYAALLFVHPPRFRRAFGAEMLYAFDQTRTTGVTAWFFRDLVISIIRQWFLRERLWLYGAAVVGGLVPLYVGLHAGQPIHEQTSRMRVGRSDGLFLIYAVGSFQAISLTTIFAVFLFRWTGRRRHA